MYNRISILVPVFNNADTLQELVTQLTRVTRDLAHDMQLVFVEDASSDNSGQVLSAMRSDGIKVIANSENFGQQASIHKGLSACTGQVVVVMDADLQDQPAAIPDMLYAMEAGGYDAVFAVRQGAYQSGFRMLSGRLFRFVIRHLTNLPNGAGGFVAMTRDVAQALARKEASRFYLAGMIGCGGYRLGAVPVRRNRRPIGQSAYSGWMRLSVGLSNLSVVLNERKTRGQG